MKRAPRKNVFRLGDDPAEVPPSTSTPEGTPAAPRRNVFRDPPDGDEEGAPSPGEKPPPGPAKPRKNRFRDYGDEPTAPDVTPPAGPAAARKNRFRDYGDTEAEGHSPAEVDDFRSGVDADLEDLGEIGLLWSFSPTFAAYLRRAREKSALSLRQASHALGLSYAYLARLETGGPARAPDMPKLFRMAELYGLDRREILHEAGFRMEVPKDVDLEGRVRRRFARLVTDDALRPALLTDEALHYIPDRLKGQWIEFARKLAALPDPAAYLDKLLADSDGDARP